MELKIDKKFIDEAVQKAVEEIKQNGIWIPDGMTNGEVIQTLFPNVNVLYDTEDDITTIYFSGDMWNEPYEKGGE